MSKSAVVRIFATTQTPDPVSPWQNETPRDGTGSGAVVAPGQVLTGAHVVADATFLQVQKIAAPDKFIARVAAICHDADLALLEIDDPAFMDQVDAIKLGEMPDFQDRVAVVGFPVGGDEISITEGVVSRIEVQQYAHSHRRLVAVTVDAAINDGNSGGPVFDEDGLVVGVAFQSLDDAENIGELVPAPIIARFLDGVKSGAARLDVPGLGLSTQSLENPTLRRVVGLEDDESGVLVASVEFGGSAHGIVKPGDAVLSIDGHDIANNGTIRYRERYRTGYDAVLGEHFVGDRVPLTLRRSGGARLDVELELQPFRRLVPRYGFDQRPSWYVFGGVVFLGLSRDYLKTWGDRWWRHSPPELTFLHDAGSRTEDRREVVILSHVLADAINVGCSPFEHQPIVSVNGQKPVDLADLVRLVEACDGIVDFRTAQDGRLVFEAKEARAANAQILERYGVPADRGSAAP